MALADGWTMVGRTGATADAAVVAATLGADVVIAFDAVRQAFERFDSGVPAILNSLSRVDQGDGVWVFRSRAGIGTIPAPTDLIPDPSAAATGISISLPEGWVSDASADLYGAAESLPDLDAGANTSGPRLIVETLSADSPDVDAAADEFIAALEDEAPVTVRDESAATLVGGVPGIALSLEEGSGAAAVVTRYLFAVTDGGFAYAVRVEALGSQWPDTEPLFDAILGSLTFLPDLQTSGVSVTQVASFASGPVTLSGSSLEGIVTGLTVNAAVLNVASGRPAPGVLAIMGSVQIVSVNSETCPSLAVRLNATLSRTYTPAGADGRSGTLSLTGSGSSAAEFPANLEELFADTSNTLEPDCDNIIVFETTFTVSLNGDAVEGVFDPATLLLESADEAEALAVELTLEGSRADRDAVADSGSTPTLEDELQAQLSAEDFAIWQRDIRDFGLDLNRDQVHQNLQGRDSLIQTLEAALDEARVNLEQGGQELTGNEEIDRNVRAIARAGGYLSITGDANRPLYPAISSLFQAGPDGKTLFTRLIKAARDDQGASLIDQVIDSLLLLGP